MQTIAAMVKKALDQVKADRCGMADRTLTTLNSKLGDGSRQRKDKPNAYALFVKSNYARVKAQHPNMEAPKIMAMLAKEWKKKHGEGR